jgi:hypothetical protein
MLSVSDIACPWAALKDMCHVAAKTNSGATNFQ